MTGPSRPRRGANSTSRIPRRRAKNARTCAGIASSSTTWVRRYLPDPPTVATLRPQEITPGSGCAIASNTISWPSAVEKQKQMKFDKFKTLATSEDTPIKPERVVAELQKVLDKDAIVVADPGTPCPYFSSYYIVRGTGRRYFSNRAHGALGYSLAASIGAHFGRPKVKTVAVMGDGSFGMCVGELETAVRLKLPITFVVISNAVYGWIKAGQKTGYAERYFSVDFGVTDHAKVAQAFGVKAFRVFDPLKLSSVLKEAVNSGEPTLVDIVCQPLQEAKAPVSEWVA